MKTARISALKSKLLKAGFRTPENPAWLDRIQPDGSLLRIVIADTDEEVELIRFTRYLVAWKLQLSFSLPDPVFDAALTATLAA